MVSSLLNSGWIPPWTTDRPHWGHVVVVQLPTELAILIDAPAPIRTWLAPFLRLWREQIEATPVDEMASFFYIVFRNDPTDSPPTLDLAGAVAEKGFGSSPRAPEEWSECDLVDLLDRTLSCL